MALVRIVAAVVVAGFVSAVPAAAAPDATRLSISVSDGVGFVTDKASVAYVATVVNEGGSPVSGELVVEVPAYARYRRAPAAKLTEQLATWTVRVPPHSTVSRRAAVRIGTIPSGALRVTSLASLFLGPVTGAPAIRAADTDRISGVVDPPGTPVPASTSPVPGTASSRPAGRFHPWLVLGLPLLGFIAIVLLGGAIRSCAVRARSRRA